MSDSERRPTSDTRLGNAPTELAAPGRGRRTRTAPPELLTAGDTIGRYLVTRRLGVGGMGEVYAAEDPDLQRPVAVKVVRADLQGTTPSDDARLLREAQAMAQLSHPNIVRVYEVDSFDGGLFVAMELIEGEALDRWLAKGGHHWREILEIFLEAGGGLVAAHRAGLVHRDFKPANVLIDAGRMPRVTDFGLVDTIEPVDLSTTDSGSLVGVRVTEPGALCGTPAYFPPEGYADRYDEQGDQYAFAVSLFEALFRVHPYEPPPGKSYLHAFSAGRPLPFPKRSPVPGRVKAALKRALSVVPEMRFPSMADFLAALTPPPRRPWLAPAAVVALTASAALAFPLLSSDAPRDLCAHVEDGADQAWSPEIAADVRAAFVQTGLAHAADTARLVDENLRRYTGAWRDARVHACRATWITYQQSEERYLEQLDCLDRALDQASALAQVFATSADTKLVDGAVRATDRLFPLERCQAPPATQPGDRVTVPAGAAGDSSTVAELDRAVALSWAGKPTEAAATLEKVLPRLLEAGDDATAAAAYAAIALNERNLGRAEEHVSALRQQSLHAGRAGDDYLLADALIATVYAVGYQQRQFDNAMTVAALIPPMLTRLGSPPLLSHRYHSNVGIVQFARGNLDVAFDEFQTAYNLLEQSPQAVHSVGLILGNLSEIERHRGNMEAAAEYARRSRDMIEQRYGPDHPSVAMAMVRLANLAVANGNPEGALPHFEGAIPLLATSHGENSTLTCIARNNYGDALRATGAHDRAAVQYERAIPGFVRAVGEKHPFVAHTRIGLAMSLIDLEELDRARAQLQAAAPATNAKGDAYLRGRLALARAMYAAQRGDSSSANRFASSARSLLVEAGATAAHTREELERRFPANTSPAGPGAGRVAR